jgi:hypothetical protein
MNMKSPRSHGRTRAREARAGLRIFRDTLLATVGLLAVLSATCPASAAPLAPTMLSAHTRMGSIQLSWTAPQGAQFPEGYRMYRSLTVGGPYALLGTVNCTTACNYLDKVVENGAHYVYVIRAFDSTGTEGPSSEEVAAVGDTVAPGASIRSVTAGLHVSGRGPVSIVGTAVDAGSGVAEVGVAIRRNDTHEWWNGSMWTKVRRSTIHAEVSGAGPTVKWTADTRGVMWSQATSYSVQVDVKDAAGYALGPAESVTMFVDTPAILTISVAAAPSAVTAGQPFSVSVLVANTGGGEATDVQVGRPLDHGSAGIVYAGGGAVEGGVPSLAPGEFATFSWSFSTTAAGTVSFAATASGRDAGSGDAAQILAGQSNDVIVRAPARLDVAVTTSPANVRQGMTMTMRMVVTNSGQSEAQVTSVSLRPAQAGLVAGLVGPVPQPPFRLRGGESQELVWTASATGAGTVAFVAAAAGYDETSGSPADAQPMTSAPVGVAAAPTAIQLSSSVDSAAVGTRVMLTATVRDAAGTPVPGVPVRFALLAGRGRLEEPSALSDERGQVEIGMTLPREAGMCTVEGRSGALLASISVEGVLPGEGGQILSRNFFDPSRAETVDVSVHLPRSSRVKVRVFSLSGELIATLADTNAPAGPAKFTWDGHNSAGATVANGVYFFSVQAGSSLTSRRVIVLKERP